MHTRLTAASDKAYQLLVHGRWFSLGIPVSSTTKTGRQDIAERLLKVALNTINKKKSHIKLTCECLIKKNISYLFCFLNLMSICVDVDFD